MRALKKFILCVAIGAVVLVTAGLILFVLPVGEEPPTPAPVAGPDSVTVLSPKAQHLWDKLLASMENKPAPPAINTSTPAPTSAGVTTTPTPAAITPQPETATPTPTPAPAPLTPPAPTATPALSAARDLTGRWTGRGVYYQLDTVTGERMRTINLDITLDIQQTGEDVVVDMNVNATKVDPEGAIPGHGYWTVTLVDKTGYTIGRNLDDPIPDGYTLKEKDRMPLTLQSFDTQWYSQLKGTVSVIVVPLTNLYNSFDAGSVMETWTFTFTTDLMSGGVQSVPLNVYLDGGKDYFGHESDPKAFTLTRQP